MVSGDAQIDIGVQTSLLGQDSSDPEGEALSYYWSLLQKPASSDAVLDRVDSATTTLVADQAGTYVVRLIVSDGVLMSRPTIWTLLAQ